MSSTHLRAGIPAALLLLAACVQPVPRVDETSAPPLPSDSYLAAAAAGAAVYRIDPAQSVVIAAIGRDGRLKHLGHDHAIASEDVAGFIEIGAQRADSRADIVMPIRNLIVDDARYRDELGLDTEPSESDIAGTYTNMLKVLEPESWPWATVQARFAADPGSEQELAVSIALHGAAFDYLVPVSLEIGDHRLVARGEFDLRHSDFGLEPYSAAGGLLRVADDVGLRFEIVALREISTR